MAFEDFEVCRSQDCCLVTGIQSIPDIRSKYLFGCKMMQVIRMLWIVDSEAIILRMNMF